MKFLSWFLPLTAGLVSAAFSVFWLLEAAVFILGGALFLWLFVVLKGRALDRKIRLQSLYLDRYWLDGEKDALERYAFYWLDPNFSRRVALCVRLAAAALLGGAAVWFLTAWGLSAVALLFAIALIRWNKRLDPVTWFETRSAAKDYTVADEWEDVLKTRQKLMNEGWPWTQS